jgi:uncharacterized protein YidB (DUF937 family)
MGIEDLLGGLLKGGGGNALVDQAKSMIAGQGLNAVVGQLTNGGLGDQVKSWIGIGDNKEISADDVKKAISADDLKKFADSSGVSMEQAASGLAAVLPGMVDKLTPEGKVPEKSGVEKLLGSIDLGKLLGGN